MFDSAVPGRPPAFVPECKLPRPIGVLEPAVADVGARPTAAVSIGAAGISVPALMQAGE
jgi:hypothetical protein